jgi:hypothetical protein
VARGRHLNPGAVPVDFKPQGRQQCCEGRIQVKAVPASLPDDEPEGRPFIDGFRTGGQDVDGLPGNIGQVRLPQPCEQVCGRAVGIPYPKGAR